MYIAIFAVCRKHGITDTWPPKWQADLTFSRSALKLTFLTVVDKPRSRISFSGLWLLKPVLLQHVKNALFSPDGRVLPK